MKLIFSEVMGRLMKELGFTEDQQMAKLMGMSNPAYSERKSRDSLPYEKIIDICRERGISSDYIFTGNRGELNGKIIHACDLSDIDDTKMMVVPYFENIQSITRDPDAQVSYIVLPKTDHPELMREDRNLNAVTITDDSMEGTILNGALLLFDINDTKFDSSKSNKVYILKVGDENMVKRLFRDPTSPATIILKSDNIYYPKFDIPNDGIDVIGRVMFVYNRGKLI